MKLFIDIAEGKCEYLSEDEVQERIELQADIEIPYYKQSEEDLQKSMEEQYILKTKMTLQQDELFTVYAQEFDYDDYHKDNTDIPSELERQVRGLKRRYPDFGDYQSAMAIYLEYMSFLYIKHGGKEVFELKDKGGFIKDYVPVMPKIKANATNKELLKNEIVVSTRSKSEENYIDVDELDYEDILEITDTDDDYVWYREYDVIKEAKPNKEFDKFVDKEVMSKKGRFSSKAESLMLRSTSSFDYLDEYFRTKNAMDEDNKKDEYSTDDLTLEDLMNDNFITEEDLMNEKDEKVYINGRILPKEQADEISAYNKLRDFGWDVNKILRRSGNVSESDIVFKRLKQIDKKERKKNKKNKKGKKDNFLSTLSRDNGHDDWESFSREMLDFTSDNIFN
ncbi:hypothetical protein [Romboutsia ilealis]|uniref:hypothetical protein n=1 Tax=Romboutsia ilealis TaxID=1115758 RepID=UPI00272D3E0A|nr:hypothetical protein [Romboutsia ilealis]